MRKRSIGGIKLKMSKKKEREKKKYERNSNKGIRKQHA